ncbi:alpha/beta hydrolase [Streptomyces sp. ME01-18a]|uniref:alpha/beta hydrolase n=1 Tax=Streptomyces sp. ME01-18a TaxID=3028669 RepID=UPI0029B5864E|nr:alpha/beta hydrolase [Streptomyces sp. ME01-18a]MDX3434165.1 alpha/beta hydrolase [Streptomyces sp. ME01-18a]
MPLDPEAARLLDARKAIHTRPVAEMTVAEARTATRSYIRLQGDPVSVARVHDVLIPGKAGVRARVYIPYGEPPFACLVHFHGGGWVAGGLDTHDRPSRALAARSGCVVVTVDYRKAPEHPFPAAVDDAWAALAWVHEQADRFGVAADRIGVSGDSAGGNLAAVACLRSRDEQGPALRFQALLYPLTDARCEAPSYLTNAVGYGVQAADLRRYWGLYLGGTSGLDHPYASPLRADDLSGLPPALVVTAEYDPVRDDGERYAARLADAGVPVTLSRYEGMIHAFYLMGGVLSRTRDLVDEIAREARNHLAP